MPEITLTLSAREAAEIAMIAKAEGSAARRSDPVEVAEMALALLQSHLILIRDCGGILPDTRPKLRTVGGVPKARRITGHAGVTLCDGMDGLAPASR